MAKAASTLVFPIIFLVMFALSTHFIFRIIRQNIQSSSFLLINIVFIVAILIGLYPI